MSSQATRPELPALARAQQAHALVQVRPREAKELAERALADAAASRDIGAEVAARHALGWAQCVLGDAETGRATWRTGIRLAERHGDLRGAGLLRRILASWLAIDGQTRAAQREIDAALVLLSGRDRAESQVHRLEVHRRSSRADPGALRQLETDVQRALARFRREDDSLWQARLLYNRGLLRLDRGELELADHDLRSALSLYSQAGADAAALNVRLAVVEVALLRGDVLGSLQALASVDHVSYNAVNLQESRLLTLVRARLLPEAREAAERFVEICQRSGSRENTARARLELSAIALMSGDAAVARQVAVNAERSLAARGQQVQAALARLASLRARLADGPVPAGAIRSGLAAANLLEHAGWSSDALRAHLVVARLALKRGSLTTARRELELASPLRTRGTASDKIELLHIRGQLAFADGRPDEAERLLDNGLRLVDDYRAALGAVELRAAVSGFGVGLAHDGLRIALDSQKPDKVLHWAERLRASALRQPLVRPPADAKLRTLQAELRRAVAQNSLRNQARLEAAIRTRTRIVDPHGDDATQIPDARITARLLGDRALVEYVELDGSLYALTLADGLLELHDLQSADAIGELDWLRAALTRLARGRLHATRRAATRAGAEASAAALDQLLIAPLRPTIGDSPLLVVPTGALHAVPWGALPSLRNRPISVAPSLAMWTAIAQRPRTRRRKTALVAGPRLRHATTEVRELAALRPGSTTLAGREATAKSTLRALDGAGIAHLACHGHFRADSPLFSSLELADGPLNVYELQNLKRAPEVVILSACELALSRLHPGDEVLGLATALLGMGTRTIVASVVLVPDATARRLMLALHRNLVAGKRPALALAQAQARIAAASFVCLGDG